MRLEISHLTSYEYDRPVQLQPHLLYLRPRENPLFEVRNFELRVAPDAKIDWMRDDFDNLPATARFSDLATKLEIGSSCEVTTVDLLPFDFMVRDYAVSFPFEYEPLHLFNLGIYRTPPDAATRSALLLWLAERFPERPKETVSWLFELNQTISQSLQYRRREEAGIQSAVTTVGLGSGTCRDYASLLVECARTLGLAARFVSGYMYDAGRSDDQPGDMHAWVEVFLPGAGWRGMDPTHGIFCTNAYVPVAHAVVAESVNPVQGAFTSPTPAAAKLFTGVRVRKVG